MGHLPVVTSLYHDRGIDHRFASWGPFKRGQTVFEEVLRTAPLRIRVTVPCEDDHLTVTLDASFSVIEADRETSRV